MRRILHFIALAFLTLMVQAQGVRTWMAPALITCQCGCDAPSEDTCGCEPTPAAPGSTNPNSGSRCPSPQAPGASQLASMAPVGLLATAQAEQRAASLPCREPNPWPASLHSRGEGPARRKLATGKTIALPVASPPDWQAHLAVFRI